MGLLTRLRPTEREVHALASLETDPRLYARFAPITRGFLFAILVITTVAVLAVICAPFWALRARR